jgi:hypothetical protein
MKKLKMVLLLVALSGLTALGVQSCGSDNTANVTFYGAGN